MSDIGKSTLLTRPDLHEASDGEFKGWRTWTFDEFINRNGPFWHRVEADRSVRCAFRGEEAPGWRRARSRRLHPAFVDYAEFAIAGLVLDCPAVTVSLPSDFLDAARKGDLIQATGEVTRAGGSLIFVRGELKTAERLIFTFSATIKRVQQRKESPTK